MYTHKYNFFIIFVFIELHYEFWLFNILDNCITTYVFSSEQFLFVLYPHMLKILRKYRAQIIFLNSLHQNMP